MTRQTLRLWLAASVTILSAVGCSESSSQPSSTVRDSAGVTIVESSRGAWSEEARWRIATVPELSIGSASGAVELQFDRVEDVLVGPNGTVVVADAGSSQIRFYDSAGNYISGSGRAGEGPGEYQRLTGLGHGPGDSLWVYDFGTRRFTILGMDGRTERTVSVGGTLSGAEAVGRLSDGSFLLREYWSSTMHEEVGGLVRPLAAVVVLAPDGSSLDTIGLHPGREVFIGTEDGRGVMSAPPYARTATAARQGDSVWVGDQTTYQIKLYTRAGGLKRLVRRTGQDLRLTQSDLDRFIDAEMAGRPQNERQMLQRMYDDVQAPDSRPAYGRILVDSDRHLWVSEWTRIQEQPVRWDVFAPDGTYLGEVEVPERFRVLQIHEGRLAGVWRDELDVEHVRLYRIHKSAGANSS